MICVSHLTALDAAAEDFIDAAAAGGLPADGAALTPGLATASPASGKPLSLQNKMPSSSTAVFGYLRARSASTTSPEAWWGQAQ